MRYNNLGEFQAKLRRFTKQFPDAVEESFGEVLPILVGDVIKTHLSGPKMAKGVNKPEPATLARGAGGGGGLVSTIQGKVKRTATRIIGMLGSSGLPYARAHEYGYPPHNLPARPYLHPTVKRNADKTKRNILRHIIRKWKRVR